MTKPFVDLRFENAENLVSGIQGLDSSAYAIDFVYLEGKLFHLIYHPL